MMNYSINHSYSFKKLFLLSKKDGKLDNSNVQKRGKLWTGQFLFLPGPALGAGNMGGRPGRHQKVERCHAPF